MLDNSREEYIISYNDSGNYMSIYESIKGDDAKMEKFINYLSRERKAKTEQEVDSRQVGDVESVVKTVNTISSETNKQVDIDDLPKAQPPILELEMIRIKKYCAPQRKHLSYMVISCLSH